MNENERVARAEEAGRIVNSPVYKEASQILLDMMKMLRLQVGPRDPDGALRLIQMEQTVERTTMFLTQIMQDGEIARQKIEEELKLENDNTALGTFKRKFRSVI